MQQWRLHALQAQKITVVVGTVGVDEDVDARAVASLDGDQGIGLILIGGDVGEAIGHGRGLVVIHKKDGAGYSDSEQYGDEEQDGAKQVAAAHPLWEGGEEGREEGKEERRKR